MSLERAMGNTSGFLKLVAVLALLHVLGGCSTTNQFVMAEYDEQPAEALPPMAVFYLRPSEEVTAACQAYDDKSMLHHCVINEFDLSYLATELADTQLFESIAYADDQYNYQLLVTTSAYNVEDSKELGSAVIAGATLMLAPISFSFDIRVDAVLTWNGAALKEYRFELPFTQKSSLLNMDQDAEADFAKSLASHFIQKFQQDDVFQPRLVYQKLEASNYEEQLFLPDQIGAYLEAEGQLYHHPFLGVQIRYIQPQFQFSRADIFVYPIRNSDWSNQQEILEAEADNFRKELALMEKEDYLQDLDIGEISFQQWDNDGQVLPVAVVKSDYVEQQRPYRSFMYLFIQQDKFIKVRASHQQGAIADADVEAFVKRLSAGIRVPAESLFMARLRKNWRDEALVGQH